jgi:hypothetical protein
MNTDPSTAHPTRRLRALRLPQPLDLASRRDFGRTPNGVLIHGGRRVTIGTIDMLEARGPCARRPARRALAPVNRRPVPAEARPPAAPEKRGHSCNR